LAVAVFAPDAAFLAGARLGVVLPTDLPVDFGVVLVTALRALGSGLR
jgi:hypothetical protein